jgi:hypothetical protein
MLQKNLDMIFIKTRKSATLTPSALDLPTPGGKGQNNDLSMFILIPGDLNDFPDFPFSHVLYSTLMALQNQYPSD